ncbi:hypothetical protein ACIP66_05785 [Pseudomonas sp. NPDC088429]|uniref:hypothetical protein n=1 Tax=Pseudomonas sp. NPDC088429 TaxID=3364455 RepID=UPI0038181A9E
MSTVIVKNIKWISQISEEAEVEISDGEFTCIAFSHPCRASIGDKVNEPLHIFSMKNAMRCTELAELGIWNIQGQDLSRKVIARVLDTSEQVVTVGKITMTIDDYLPGGIIVGDLIEFECARIDLW